MTTKTQQAAISEGPFRSTPMSDLVDFFGTKKAAKRFLVDFSEAREDAIRSERREGRSIDCTFPEQFWDGRLFLDSDDLHDRGIDRTTLPGFRRDAYVEDEAMEADIHLIRHMRERIIVVEWTWKDDEYALDAWLADKT